MSCHRSQIKKILLISLSNIGDVILTFPVVDILKHDFPHAKLSIVVGTKAELLLKGNSHFDTVHVFNKQQQFMQTIKWINELRKERFDLVVDLRNTAIPLFIFPRERTSLIVRNNTHEHMKDKHLKHLRSVYPFPSIIRNKYAIHLSRQDGRFVEQLIKNEIGENKKFVILAPGSAHPAKVWEAQSYAGVADHWAETYGLKSVIIGDESDRKISFEIEKSMDNTPLNLCGRTSLLQTAELMKHSCLFLGGDSAPMHLASYLDIPVVALFGPTNPAQYGPWSSNNIFVKSKGRCSACQKAETQDEHTCMKAIKISDVLNVVYIRSEKVTLKTVK